jgi:hypothetical protein
MVTLNRAVAAAMVDGPTASLALLDGIDDRLAGHHRLDGVRARLLEMAGNHDAAITHYRMATGRTTRVAERDYLTTRASGNVVIRSAAATLRDRPPRERQGTSRSSLTSHMSTEARTPGVSAASIALNACAPASMSCAVAKYWRTTAVP